MTSDRLAGAVLILRPMSSDDDAVLDAIREEMRCAEVYRDAKCTSPYLTVDGTDEYCNVNGEHVMACPYGAAEAAWMTATDARRKCV